MNSDYDKLLGSICSEFVETSGILCHEFSFTLKGMSKNIIIKIYYEPNGPLPYRFDTNFYIKTPSQIDRYVTSRPYGDTVEYALHLAFTSIASYYEQAVRQGHQPSDAWLVANSDF